MEHQIMFDDQPESFVLAPYRNDAGRLIGFTLAINTPVWYDFTTIGMTWQPELIRSLRENWGVRFWQLPRSPQIGYRFGFRRGIRIDRTDPDWTILRVLFQKEERRGFSTALNLHWLLGSLFDSSAESSVQNGVSQLFAVGTGVSIDPSAIHGFAVWVTVSKHCAGLLEKIPGNTDFPAARRLIAEAWRYYGLRIANNWMQAHVRNKGILQISAAGNCNCLGTNPDERIPAGGYSMFSHNTDTATHQITLLVGLAEIWCMLREKLPHNPLS